MKIIFIVDDNETYLMTTKQALGNKYKSYALPSAARMLKLAEKEAFLCITEDFWVETVSSES